MTQFEYVQMANILSNLQKNKKKLIEFFVFIIYFTIIFLLILIATNFFKNQPEINTLFSKAIVGLNILNLVLIILYGTTIQTKEMKALKEAHDAGKSIDDYIHSQDLEKLVP